MTPDIDLQLRVVIKALQDVVAPAVDTQNRLAIEQLHLAVATLAMVRSRLPYVHTAARFELSNAIFVAVSAARIVDAGSLDGLLATARAALNDPNETNATLESLRESVLGAVGALVRETEDPARQRALAQAVVRASKPQFELSRAWGLPAGFEPDPGEVPTLDGVLSTQMSGA